MKQTLTIATIAIGFIAGASALSVLAQTSGGWTAPTAAPPGGNVASPINTGSTAQQKGGWLGVTGLITANLQIASGTPGLGNILVSDANGYASWQAPSIGSAIPSNIMTFRSAGLWTVPAGVTRVLVRAWSGGGGGFCGGGGGNGSAGGDGGYAEKVLSVSPGDLISYIVGSSGSAGLRTGGDCSSGHPAPGAGGATTVTYKSTTVINITGGGAATSQSGGVAGSEGHSNSWRCAELRPWRPRRQQRFRRLPRTTGRGRIRILNRVRTKNPGSPGFLSFY